MINFKEELAKYKPILEVDDIEDTIYSNELQDIFDMLQYVSRQNKTQPRTDRYPLDKE